MYTVTDSDYNLHAQNIPGNRGEKLDQRITHLNIRMYVLPAI